MAMWMLCCVNRTVPRSFFSNEIGNKNAWLTVRLVGTDGNTDAIGAQVQLEVNGTTLLREVICGASYLSGNRFASHLWVSHCRADRQPAGPMA